MTSGAPIDRGWAWMILLGSHICLAFLIGGYKSLGIIFVEFKEMFGASSAKTALLMGLIPGGMSLLSPFATAIGERTSFRIVAIIGGVICGLGTFLTAFAPNMTYVILVFGLLTGVGYGFAFSPSIVIVGQYFHKRRSLANGLAFAGGSIGQLLIPLMLRALTDELGFRNALMVYAGLVLNIVVGASLFRPIASYAERPRPRKTSDVSARNEEKTLSDDFCEDCGKHKRHYRDEAEHSESAVGTYVRPVNKLLNRVKRESESHSDLPEVEIEGPRQPRGDFDSDGSFPDFNQNGDLLASDSAECQCEEGDMYSKHQFTSTGSLCYMQEPPQIPSPTVEDIAKKRATHDSGTFCEAIAASFCCCVERQRSVKPLFNWSLFKEPLYVLWIMGICVGNCGYVNSVVFLPPYLNQIGFSKYTAAIILSAAGVCDLVGRIAGGWFGDLGLVQRHNFMAFCMLLTSAACLVFAMIGLLSTAIMYAVFVGVLGGSYIALMAVVLVDFIGVEQLPNGFGIGVFFMGLFNVPTPALLGLLRDYTGSYREVYIVSAIMMGLCGVIFFIANIVLHLRKKKSAMK